MNTIIQNLLVFLAFLGAIVFLIRTFIWKPKKPIKPCNKNGCGCN